MALRAPITSDVFSAHPFTAGRAESVTAGAVRPSRPGRIEVNGNLAGRALAGAVRSAGDWRDHSASRSACSSLRKYEDPDSAVLRESPCAATDRSVIDHAAPA